jgi:hypothetical protein
MTNSAWRDRMRVIADAEQRARESHAAIVEPAAVVEPTPPKAESFEKVFGDVIDHLVAHRLAEATRRWYVYPTAGTALEQRQRTLLDELIENAPNLQPALVEILALSIFDGARPDVSALRAYVAANPRSSVTARSIVKRRARQLALLVGDALEPPVKVSFHELVESVLQHLFDGRVEEAKARWDAQTDSHDRDSARYPLVNELVRVARYLQPVMVQALVAAIRGGGAPLRPDVVEALTMLALGMPDRIHYELGILERLAPTLADLVGTVVRGTDEDDPLEPRAEPRPGAEPTPAREPSRRGNWALVASFVVMVCLLVAVLMFVLRPNSLDRRYERPAPTPSKKWTGGDVQPPLADDASESRERSLLAMRHSIRVLARHEWRSDPALFEDVMDALARSDCARAITRQRSLAVTHDAPREAHEHVEAIQRRVVRLCQADARVITPM